MEIVTTTLLSLRLTAGRNKAARAFTIYIVTLCLFSSSLSAYARLSPAVSVALNFSSLYSHTGWLRRR
jgi:hypothetical protein